jgi:adenosine deaminase
MLLKLEKTGILLCGSDPLRHPILKGLTSTAYSGNCRGFPCPCPRAQPPQLRSHHHRCQSLLFNLHAQAALKMCKGPMHALLETLPKCEQHLHLEGTLEPSLLFSLAKENGISLPSAESDPAFASIDSLLKRYAAFTSLDDFLHYYFIGMSVLVKAADFEALAMEYFNHAKRDGVVHAEVFFDPQCHTARGVSYATVVQGFTKACHRAETELGITTELIMCFMRHLPCASAEEVYNEALPDLKNGRLSGIGLSASEKGNPPELFESVYAVAEKEGIRRTAHAGEEADVSYMRGALEHLHVQRVDHGIRLPDDPELLEEFVSRKMLITMCPISNLKLRCVQSIGDLPIRLYLDKGVKFSINSDDPAYFGAYILDNYCAVQEAFSLTKEDWEVIVESSIEGSWCSNSRKREMITALRTTMSEHR